MNRTRTWRTSGQSQTRGERTPIVSRLATTSFSTEHFCWFHEEGWEEQHYDDVLMLKNPIPCGLYSSIPFVKRGSRSFQSSPQMIGRWLLLSTEEKHRRAISYAEISMIKLAFTTAQIQVVIPKQSSYHEWPGALACFISAAIIISEAEIVRLVPIVGASESGTTYADGAFEAWGQARQFWTPRDSLVDLALALNSKTGISSGGQLIPYRLIVSSEWWKTPDGLNSQKMLHYLEQRRQNEQERAKTKRKKLSFKQRISRFLRWS